MRAMRAMKAPLKDFLIYGAWYAYSLSSMSLAGRYLLELGHQCWPAVSKTQGPLFQCGPTPADKDGALS